MISLKSLILENFRSFQGKHEVEFTQGFYCIKGFSGVGKSNILLGISYALGLSPVPATQLQNLFTEAPMRVTLVLDKDGETIEISRGKNPSYKDSTFSGSGASVVNEKVAKLFDGQLDSVDLLTIRNQRTNGRFLSLDDSKKKSFLSTILGLTKLEDMIEFQKEKLRDAKAYVEVTSKQLETAKAFMPKQTPDDLVDLQKKILVCKEDLKAHRIMEEVARSTYEGFEARRQRKIDGQMQKLREFNKSIGISNAKLANEMRVLAIHEDSIKEIQSSKTVNERTITRIEKELKALTASLAKNFESLDTLAKNLCFTCGQKWAQVAEEEARLLKVNVDIRNQEIGLTESIKALNESIKTDQLKLPALEAVLLEQATKVETLKASIPTAPPEEEDPEMDWITSEAKEYDQKAKHAAFQQTTIGRNIAVLESKYDRALLDADNAAKLQVELGELRKKLMWAEIQAEDYKLSIEMNREFLTKIFDEILYEISNNVNNNLSLIPNVKNISFEFTTVNTTKDGSVKNKIETNIYKNGIKMPGISGGQTSSLELLVDASVHSVISARTGLSLNWLILDEPFEGLHPQDKEACLEILKSLHPNKCVLIVDHSTETKEHFDGFFEVVSNEDGLSEIKATK